MERGRSWPPSVLQRGTAALSANAYDHDYSQGGRESDMGGPAGRHSHTAGEDRVEEGDAEGSEGDAGSGAPLKWHQIPNVRSLVPCLKTCSKKV